MRDGRSWLLLAKGLPAWAPTSCPTPAPGASTLLAQEGKPV